MQKSPIIFTYFVIFIISRTRVLFFIDREKKYRYDGRVDLIIIAVWETIRTMKTYKPFKSGKVREVYDAGDSIIMVATDRISAFDHILKNKITKKGAILTQMSRFWFDLTKDIMPNHMISVDNKDMPEFFQQEQFLGNSMKCKKLKMIPMECIVRGYITGSGWESYQQDGTVCGIKLPAGLKESEKLPEPIFTPSTKAELGDHDENVSLEEGAAFIDKTFPGKGKEYAEKIRDYTLAIYKKCAVYAGDGNYDDSGRGNDYFQLPDSQRMELAGFLSGTDCALSHICNGNLSVQTVLSYISDFAV